MLTTRVVLDADEMIGLDDTVPAELMVVLEVGAATVDEEIIEADAEVAAEEDDMTVEVEEVDVTGQVAM